MYPQNYARALKAIKFGDGYNDELQHHLNSMTTADWIGAEHSHADIEKRLRLSDLAQHEDIPGYELLQNPNQIVHWNGQRFRPGLLRTQHLARLEDRNGRFTREFAESGYNARPLADQLEARTYPADWLVDPYRRLNDHYGNVQQHFTDNRRLIHMPDGEGAGNYEVHRLHIIPDETPHHNYVRADGTTYHRPEPEHLNNLLDHTF